MEGAAEGEPVVVGLQGKQFQMADVGNFVFRKVMVESKRVEARPQV